MEGQDLSPPQVDASRPSLGFPLGTALLLIIIFTLSGVFSCCYHWDKFRSFRQSQFPSSPTKSNLNIIRIEEAKQGRKLAGVDARGRASQVHCDALPLPADAASQGPRRQHRHCEGGEATAAASHPFIFVS
ncbi:hypothetical protein AHAS_Ahas03G0303500 [Arachis hypogaea]|uniref:Hydroxyproline-rich glycoprotein family protein n=1 Tax=Arachis hypogaea TaxID=3818 RepID=A0A445DQ36_ARAHY|nr:hypothetical protein Ahy_A03g011226 [Arachis hypogaea]